MKSLLRFGGLVAVIIGSVVGTASASILAIDISTTAAPATPLYGANFTNQIIVGDAYGTNYRDYQIALTATSPISLSDFAITVKGDIQQNTADTAVLGITMWTGPIVASPTFGNSIVTVWTNALGLPKNGFFNLNLGLGNVSPNQSITTTPSVFHLRVWGSGTGSSTGFKVKLADGVNLLYDPLGTSLIVSNYNTNTSTYSPASTYTYTGPGGNPAVPEAGTWVAGVMIAAIGILATASRRRKQAEVPAA